MLTLKRNIFISNDNNIVWLERLPQSKCGCSVKYQLAGMLNWPELPSDELLPNMTIFLTQMELTNLCFLKNENHNFDNINVSRDSENSVVLKDLRYLRATTICEICNALQDVTEKAIKSNDIYCEEYKLIVLPSKCGCNNRQILQALNPCVVPHETITSPPKAVIRSGPIFKNFLCTPVHRGIYHIIRCTPVSNSIAVKYIKIAGNICTVCKPDFEKSTNTVSMTQYEYSNFIETARKMLRQENTYLTRATPFIE